MAFLVSLEEYDCLIAERINDRGLSRPPCDIRKAVCFETGIHSYPYQPHSIRILFLDWISCIKSVMPACTRITGAYLPPTCEHPTVRPLRGEIFGWPPMVCTYVWGVEPPRHRLEALACVIDFSVFCKFHSEYQATALPCQFSPTRLHTQIPQVYRFWLLYSVLLLSEIAKIVPFEQKDR